ncbi:dethiobiotin synthase [Corynebacterium sp. sy039]|uniref:dethiobiotin synthase n=1 Tax=Corynebacterium sp. sy039 TaxID=2599641 RepID=UPI0011B4C077|nr:dethiobiotin synthase [Corynebacterium sp. sy039]QDZ42566.1 ATP-dependent dethiobiotin synthetase BioD [Corynebacterium sp. sy039]
MSIFIVTGTNTDVGKTIATAALAVKFQQAGYVVEVLKPVQTGEVHGSGDAVTIERLSGVKAQDLVRYPDPLAPNLAARYAGLPQVGFRWIMSQIRDHHARLGETGILLVEGAGGLLVRLADTFSIADIAQELSAPLIVVSSLGLGSLNSAELTIEAARHRGLSVRGIIGGSMPAEPDLATRLNIAELEVLTGIKLLGCIPEGSGQLSRTEFVRMVENQLLLPEIE